jgi:putative oxidoreductase
MLKSITKAYQGLIFFGGLLKSPILLLCRLFWGALFVAAGWEKLSNIPHFAQLLETYHFPAPTLMAYLAACSEFFGGLCLLFGFASRLAAIPLIITMLTAYSTVHVEALKSFFKNPSLFTAEAPFNFLLTALLVLAFGPGRFSIDYMLEKWLFSRSEDIPKHQHLS